MIHIDWIKCDDRTEPIGIDDLSPYFTWRLSSEEEGILQEQYRLRILEENGRPVYDSGSVKTRYNECRPEALPLASRTEYSVNLSIWVNGEKYNAQSRFETGLLQPEDWQAKWIGGENLLRRTFFAEKAVRKARVYVTGLGFYFCYINGKRIGKAEAAPSFTDYNVKVEYSVFDITQDIQTGENVFGMMLGGHWNTVLYPESVRTEAYYHGENMGLAQLEIVYTDGTQTTIFTDDGFACHASPVVDSSIYNGEWYDATRISPHWLTRDDSAADWSEVKIFDFHTRLVAQSIPSVEIIKELAPVKRWNFKNRIVFDFGENISGKLRISATAKRGAKIKMRHSEILNDDKTLNIGTLRAAIATDEYVFSGEGKELYTPFFTYHGFRYAEISGEGVDLSSVSVAALEVRSAVQDLSSFQTSSEPINRIYKIMKRTFANNLFGIPTDCHQRDERQGWLADAHLASEAIMYNYDMRAFYMKFLDDIADSQLENGNLFYFTVPGKGWGESLMWTGGYYMLVDYCYKRYHDIAVIKKHYTNLVRYFDYLESIYGEWGLKLNGFGDWLGVQPTKEEHIREAVFIDYANKLADFSLLLGSADAEEHYRRRAQELREIYNDRYYSPHESTYKNSGYYGTCNDISQLSNALAICYDIPFAKDLKRVQEKLIWELTESRGETMLTTGLVGTKYLFDALSKIGRNDIALDLFMRERYPSWIFMLEKDATTVWERWEYMIDNEMNSHCHVPLAAPCKWLFASLAGIQTSVVEPDGLTVFPIAPYFTDQLSHVSASVDTSYGKLSVHWERDRDSYLLTITVPCGTAAQLGQTRYYSGTHKAKVESSSYNR